MKPCPSQDKELSIDESWLAQKTVDIPEGIVQCSICYQVPSQPVECNKCGNLFCKVDYKDSIKLKDSCPCCKQSPWVLRQKIHKVYANIIQKLKYYCKECKDDNKYKFKQLLEHLKKDHNIDCQKYENNIYKYFIQTPNQKIKLNLYQNLQIYQRLTMENISNFQIFDAEYDFFTLNFQNNSAIYKDPQTKVQTKGVLIKQIVSDPKHDPQLNTQQEYIVWTVLNYQKYNFYLQQHQNMMEKGYQQYLSNKNYSQIHIDMKNIGIRYRIDFKKMKQLNLKTQFERDIKRSIIKLKPS